MAVLGRKAVISGNLSIKITKLGNAPIEPPTKNERQPPTIAASPKTATPRLIRKGSLLFLATLNITNITAQNKG
jgi:hypothetical protein